MTINRLTDERVLIILQENEIGDYSGDLTAIAELSRSACRREGIRVQGNEQVLRQCMDILLDNAQKYSDPGTVHVRLRKSGRQAELTVANPSPELSREECRNIFKRFYRRDTARTAAGSYGLGLSIAEGIVERHKGKISCGWENGEICFTVIIPMI